MIKTVTTFAASTTIALALAFCNQSLSAQETQETTRTDHVSTTASDTRPNEAFNYGWLGLAGLVGLLGLLPRNRGMTGVTVRDGAGNAKSSARP